MLKWVGKLRGCREGLRSGDGGVGLVVSGREGETEGEQIGAGLVKVKDVGMGLKHVLVEGDRDG